MAPSWSDFIVWWTVLKSKPPSFIYKHILNRAQSVKTVCTKSPLSHYIYGDDNHDDNNMMMIMMMMMMMMMTMMRLAKSKFQVIKVFLCCYLAVIMAKMKKPCSDEVIQKRYWNTRRPSPMARNPKVQDKPESIQF